MLMLDVCSGLGGASAAMRARGWDVVTIDINPAFNPDICADVKTWRWTGARPDLIWCSPPCTEFAREFMPWCKTGIMPDLSLVRACKEIIAAASPRYWVIENVRGAIRYLGSPQEIHGAFMLWGHFPPLGLVKLDKKKKESYSSTQDAERGRIPYSLSLRLAKMIEHSRELFTLAPYEGIYES